MWLYYRFLLSHRDVEELLAERGIPVSYETIRRWCRKFGPAFANGLRRRRPRPGDKWHMDEVQLTINGGKHWLWRAVDQEGVVLDILVQERRTQEAAEAFLRRVVEGTGYRPRVVVTDTLASYPSALLRMLRGFEALAHPFSSAGRAVAVLPPIIQALVPPMLYPGEHAAHGGRVAGQRVRNHHPRCVPAPVDHTTEKGLRGLLVASRLDEDVEYHPLLVHRSPQPVLPPVDPQLHFIDMPLVPRSGTALAHPISERLPELLAPAAHGLVAGGDAPLRQQLFHVPVDQQEAVVQPHGMADEIARKPVALVEQRRLMHRRVLRHGADHEPAS